MPWFVAADAPGDDPDIEIDIGSPTWVESPPTSFGHRYAPGKALMSFLPDGAVFGILDGRKIVVDAHPSIDLSNVHASLVGPVLGITLVQRGVPVLHASAVEVGGQAVAIAGPSTMGKSTTAAALHLLGHRLVADDVVALADEGRSVIPSFPLIKLWPDAARRLGLDPERIPRLEVGYDKLAFDASEGFRRDHLPLGAVVLLAQGAERVQQLTGSDALTEMVAQSFGVEAIHASGHEHNQFLALARVAREIPVIRVGYGPGDEPRRLASRILDVVERFAVVPSR